MNTEMCPRCYGSPAIVCCALCRGKNPISSILVLKYKELAISKRVSNLSIDDTLRLRSIYVNRERILDKMIIEKLMTLDDNNFNIIVGRIHMLLNKEDKTKKI